MSTGPAGRQVCRRCLNYQGMFHWLNPRHVPPGVLAHLSEFEDGVCGVCRAYARVRDARAQAQQRAALTRRLRAGEPALVLCSGGKDSVATLAQVRRMGRGPVTALLFDNGFIPRAVVAQAQRVCRSLEVPLVVARPAVVEKKAFHQLVTAPGEDAPPPCDVCATQLFAHAQRFMDGHGVSILVAGSNYWAQWRERPDAVVDFVTAGKRPAVLAHLPYLLRWKRRDVVRMLRELEFEPHALQGVSSNCRVPALVQAQVSAQLGHVPELEDLSLEVMVGHLGRKDAIAELFHKAPGQRAVLEALFGALAKAA